jgi:hypothetical protein
VKCYYCGNKLKWAEAEEATDTLTYFRDGGPYAHHACNVEAHEREERRYADYLEGEKEREEEAAQVASEKRCPFRAGDYRTGKCRTTACMAWGGTGCQRLQ